MCKEWRRKGAVDSSKPTLATCMIWHLVQRLRTQQWNEIAVFIAAILDRPVPLKA